jgi:hypothetical protein
MEGCCSIPQRDCGRFSRLFLLPRRGAKASALAQIQRTNWRVGGDAGKSIYKSSHPDVWMRLIRAMAAAVPTTGASFQVIRRGENHVSVVVQIEIPFIGSGFTMGQGLANPRENDFGISLLARNLRDRFETRPAQARRFKTTRRQTTQDVVGNNDFMTPARTFIEMSLGHATAVVAAA